MVLAREESIVEMNKDILIRAQTITPVWTGDANRESPVGVGRSLAGHLRWWYEVLVRGLGGYACDPQDGTCSVPPRCGEEPPDLSNACAVCRLWGCRGWRARFRMTVTDARGKPSAILLNRALVPFGLRFSFDGPVRDEELWLLDRTLRLVTEYGVLGGRAPGAHPSAGVVKFSSRIGTQATRETVRSYLAAMLRDSETLAERAGAAQEAYPDLRFFFFNNQVSLSSEQVRAVRQAESNTLQEHGIDRAGRIVRVEDRQRRFFGYTLNGKALSNILMKLLQLDVRGTLTGGQVLHAL